MITITISTPSYNSESTIEETISSVISQDYPLLEYNIIDGKSTDSTLLIAKKYLGKGITNIYSERDNGISDAFNKGVMLAKGELIGNINSDDILLPGALKIISDAIENDTDVIYGDGIRIYEDGSTRPYKCLPIKKLYSCMALVHPAVFVRRRCYERFGLFDLKYKSCMDRELMLRMYDGGAKFQYVNKPLVGYRMGGASDKYYFKYTLPEREEISIKYGMPVYKAKWETLMAHITMRLTKLKNNNR